MANVRVVLVIAQKAQSTRAVQPLSILASLFELLCLNYVELCLSNGFEHSTFRLAVPRPSLPRS